MGFFDFLTEEIAIDLGTANTLIIHNDKVVVDSPSIVAKDRISGKIIAVGNEANLMQGKTHENIKTIKLDDFKEEVDFMKIDVEGMENLVLEGSKKLVINYRPFLFIELFKSKLENVIEFFKNKDYNIYSTGRNAYAIPIEAKVNFTGLKKML